MCSAMNAIRASKGAEEARYSTALSQYAAGVVWHGSLTTGLSMEQHVRAEEQEVLCPIGCFGTCS